MSTSILQNIERDLQNIYNDHIYIKIPDNIKELLNCYYLNYIIPNEEKIKMDKENGKLIPERLRRSMLFNIKDEIISDIDELINNDLDNTFITLHDSYNIVYFLYKIDNKLILITFYKDKDLKFYDLVEDRDELIACINNSSWKNIDLIKQHFADLDRNNSDELDIAIEYFRYLENVNL